MNDVRNYIYGALVVFVVGISLWISILFVNACGFTLTCKRGQLAVYRTPIPTLIPATLPVSHPSGALAPSTRCRVAAVDLIGAWVNAGSPQSDSFDFTDSDGLSCSASFADVKPLFIEANLWYPGSISCVSCHGADVANASAQLDLTGYAGIKAGSGRADAQAKGTDILGGKNWKSSRLFEFLTTPKADVPGHTERISSLVIFAGTPNPHPLLTNTPQPAATPTP